MKLVLVIFICFTYQIIPVSASDTHLVITTNEAPPFSGSTLKKQGVSIEIMKEAFKRGGYTAHVRFYPWKRALQMTKKGLCDGIIPIWYTVERATWCDYSKPIHTPSILGIFAPVGTTTKITLYEELKSHHIGYVMGFAYDRSFYDNLPDFNATYFYSPLDLMRALVMERIELAVVGKHQGAHILNHVFPEHKNRFRFLKPALERREHYLAISKKAQKGKIKLKAFNKGLTAMAEDGTLAKILAAHNMKDL